MNKMNIQVLKNWLVKSPLKRERIFGYLLIATGVLIAANFLYLAFNFHSEGVIFPLRYNYLFGIVKTGSWKDLYLLPFLALIITGINVFFSQFFYKKDKLISYVFLAINIFLCIIIFLETIALVARSI